MGYWARGPYQHFKSLVYRPGGMMVNRTLYSQHRRDIWKLAPTSHVMEFDFKLHGWSVLAKFLERPVPFSASTAWQPFPRTRAKSYCWDAVAFQLFPARFLGFWVLQLASVAVSYLVVSSILCLPEALFHLAWIERRVGHCRPIGAMS